MYQIKMSVKALAEFLYQQGDLGVSFLSPERANIGSRIHRKLQKQGGEHYQSEVFLKEETIIDDLCFIIDGRETVLLKVKQESFLTRLKVSAVILKKFM